MQSRELEVKFAVAAGVRAGLREHCARCASSPPQVQNLKSRYFDTAEQVLRRNGISWRVRQTGDVFLQTIKLAIGVHGGVSQPVEIEAPVANRSPSLEAVSDKALRRKLSRLIKGASLSPMFDVNVERSVYHVERQSGVVEIAFDAGSIIAGTAEGEISEIEFELKAGAPDVLLQVITEVFGKALPEPATRSKSAAGFALLNAEAEGLPEPVKGQLPALDGSMTAAAALAEVLRAVAAHILANWRVVLHSDAAEGPHQLRIGIRRLRTALRAFSPLLKKEAVAAFKPRLRQLAALVGELRDADVQLTDIVEPVLAHGEWGIAAGPLRALLLTRQSEARRRVRAGLQSPDGRRLQIEIGLMPALLTHDTRLKSKQPLRPVRDLADEALMLAWERVAKRAGAIATLGAEDRHALRKDLKALRYTAGFFAGLFRAKQVAAFDERLSALQGLFGYLNDVATAERLAGEVKAGGANPEAEQALAYAIGWHTARAENTWRNARDAWTKLRKTRRFWMT